MEIRNVRIKYNIINVSVNNKEQFDVIERNIYVKIVNRVPGETEFIRASIREQWQKCNFSLTLKYPSPYPESHQDKNHCDLDGS